MARRVVVSIQETLNRRTDDFRRHLLIDGYRELANDTLDLWALNLDPNPPAPRMTKRLALLESLSGHTPPADVLTVRDLLALARRRSLG